MATLLGCGLAWIGLVVPAAQLLYDYAWFVGFGAAGVTHLVLTKLSTSASAKAAIAAKA